MNGFMIVVTLQTFTVFVLLIVTIALFARWKHRTYSNLFLFSFVALINDFGYLLEITGKTSAEMLIGTKVGYLGKVFIPYAILLFVVQYFELKIPTIINVLLLTYHTAVFILVFTCDYHKLFYKSIRFSNDGLFPHNVYEHGLVYKIYVASVVVYMALFVVYIFYKFSKTTNKKKRKQMLMIFLTACVPMLSYIIYMTGITRGYDCTSVAYFVCTILMGVAIINYDLLEVIEAVGDYISDNISSGLIAVDIDGNYVYNNAPALEMYPDLKNNSRMILEDIIEKERNSELIKRDNKVYKVKSTNLASNYRDLGRLYILDDITEEYFYNENIKQLALTDGLTGVGNRRAFEKAIAEYAGKRINTDFIYVAMDINGLKKVNDTYGHAAGDELIIAASDCIKRSFGQYGKVYRTGGDEFIVMMNAKPEEYSIAREMLITLINSWTGDIDEELVISVGAASHQEFPDYTAFELAKEADSRMYADKRYYYIRTGKDRRR